uniref:BRCA1-associated protein-like n=1 Tax=Petromyzon marinus TaxID=7757 RepID=A0AAJ7XJA0_PETMA
MLLLLRLPMSVTLVALRLELSPDSSFPSHFHRCHCEPSVADAGMSSADSAKELRAEIQRSLGSREMHNISIETVTFNHDVTDDRKPRPSEPANQGAPTPAPAVGGTAERKSPPPPAGGDQSQGVTDSGVLQGSAPCAAPSERLSPALPDEIPFFSGNPSVEIVHGVMHLYKTSSPMSPSLALLCMLSPMSPSLALLCMLAVPSSTTSHELLRFLGPAVDSLQHVKVVRDSTPNFYMVLLHFLTQ